MAYNGYLAPHMGLIRDLTAQGKTRAYIAALLYDYKGVRSPNIQNGLSRDEEIRSFSGLIGLALYGPPKKKPQWQVWTPEMQAAEIEREYTAAPPIFASPTRPAKKRPSIFVTL